MHRNSLLINPISLPAGDGEMGPSPFLRIPGRVGGMMSWRQQGVQPETGITRP